MVSMFEKVVKILPRHKLEELLGNEAKPWQLDRITLQQRVIKNDSAHMRDEIIEYMINTLSRGQ